jgi:PleD family two-component response regulator
MIPISTPNNTLSSVTETPLSPPKTPIPLPLPTHNENVGVATDAIPPAEVKEEVEERQGLRVLLVEDNEINLKLLIATMRKLKLEHATATNGLEAFNSYKEVHGKFDVVFMGAHSPLIPFSEDT